MTARGYDHGVMVQLGTLILVRRRITATIMRLFGYSYQEHDGGRAKAGITPDGTELLLVAVSVGKG
jgi:hypothetical protein